MDKCKLKSPQLLAIESPENGRYTGGSQIWFHDSWKRTSGCGPTAASGMLWYIARSRKIGELCETGKADKACFLRLMDAVFDHVTPSIFGVYSAGLFMRGVLRYGKYRGVSLQTRALTIPPKLCKRPTDGDLRDFITESLNGDLPVAFLNRSNGSLTNLGSWHWVMIVALEPDSMIATICDYGAEKEIRLGEWLKTTLLGGGLVSINYEKGAG